MVEPIAPISASGVQSSVAQFEDADQLVASAALGAASGAASGATASDPAADVVAAKPTHDADGTPLEAYPPAFVFAPGFLHADRRGIVAYPGMELNDPLMKLVLTERYVQANAVVFQQIKDLYDDIVKLGKPIDPNQS